MEITINLYQDFKEQGQEWIEAAQEAYKLYSTRKEIEKLEKKAFERLKVLSNGYCSRGADFVFESSLRKGAINYGEIEILKHLDLEGYRRPDTQVWKLKKI